MKRLIQIILDESYISKQHFIIQNSNFLFGHEALKYFRNLFFQ